MSFHTSIVSQKRLEMIVNHLTGPINSDEGRRMGIEDRMIRSAVAVDGFVNPIAYDENHQDEYGYFVCKTCKQLWSVDSDSLPFDEKRCLTRRVDKNPNAELSKDVIYVMGPNDNGVILNYQKIPLTTLIKWGAIDLNTIKAQLTNIKSK